MEKADSSYRHDLSPPGTVTPDGHQDVEYGANGTALSTRKRLSSQRTNNPNDPVSKQIECRQAFTKMSTVELAIVVKVCDLVAGLFIGSHRRLEHGFH
jgi:hypothetical protein